MPIREFEEFIREREKLDVVMVTTADVTLDQESTYPRVTGASTTMDSDGLVTIKFTRKLYWPRVAVQEYITEDFAPEIPNWQFKVSNVRLEPKYPEVDNEWYEEGEDGSRFADFDDRRYEGSGNYRSDDDERGGREDDWREDQRGGDMDDEFRREGE